MLTTGLIGLACSPTAISLDIAWRTALCGIGFGFFQSPNNRAMIGATPRERSGGASGAQATTRLLGQTTGTAVVALLFSLDNTAPRAWRFIRRLRGGIGAASASAACATPSLHRPKARPSRTPDYPRARTRESPGPCREDAVLVSLRARILHDLGPLGDLAALILSQFLRRPSTGSRPSVLSLAWTSGCVKMRFISAFSLTTIFSAYGRHEDREPRRGLVTGQALLGDGRDVRRGCRAMRTGHAQRAACPPSPPAARTAGCRTSS
jgi:hypothetical protein